MSYVENIHSLPIPVIKIPDLLLRDIDQTSEAFILLVEDVRANGVQVPLNVREVTAENGAKLYYLIDGRQRLGAAEVVGLSEVPVRVQVCSDLKAAMASARLNLQRSQPSPAAYAKYLKEYLLLNPATSFETLAVEIGQKPPGTATASPSCASVPAASSAA
jgi:ParB-like chromosome segregation protein Spo0J